MWPFMKRALWEMGTINGKVARRNRITGECQFVLWKAGEQGHTEDYWHRYGDGWAELFVPDSAALTGQAKKGEG